MVAHEVTRFEPRAETTLVQVGPHPKKSKQAEDEIDDGREYQKLARASGQHAAAGPKDSFCDEATLLGILFQKLFKFVNGFVDDFSHLGQRASGQASTS